MGTPFVAFLEPTRLDDYDPSKPHDQQSANIPKTFVDAMEVRETVFVHEQNVPLQNEFDADDPRACHWVAYASVNTVQEPEVRDDTGRVVQPRKSVTRSTPIGTIRVVPFPHPPHPRDGGDYWNGELRNSGDDGEVRGESITRGDEERRLSAQIPFPPKERPTTYHDGKEPYVKVGRLAVLKEYRGKSISKLLMSGVLSWLRSNPSYFDPSVREVGLEQLGVDAASDIPKWNGLVIVHGQEQVAKFWERWGFKVDPDMGRWFEEGIPHVGLVQRLHIEPKKITI